MIRKNILKNIENEYVSENDLIEKLNTTHEKLNENIAKLIEAGYEINHDNDKGYKLVNTPDILEPFEIQRKLTTKYIGHSIHYYKEVTSTNDMAEKLVDMDASEGSVIIAEKQTAGRSRKKTDWISPKGGIWMTIILRPDVDLLEASKLTIVAGVALAKTLNDEFNIDAGIKWPNDILIGDKKICGILTEAITEKDKIKAVLVGIGLDVNLDEEEIPDDLKPIATTIKKYMEKTIKRSDILNAFFNQFEEFYDEFIKGNFKYTIKEWRRLSTTTGKRVKVYKKGKALCADAIGIDNSGALIVELDDGELEKITSGEVKILKEE